MNKYDKLVKVTAAAVDALVELAPIVDATGTVSYVLRAEPRIWEHLSKEVIERLAEGYGLNDTAAGTRAAEELK